jgi:hypothetical protein
VVGGGTTGAVVGGVMATGALAAATGSRDDAAGRLRFTAAKATMATSPRRNAAAIAMTAVGIERRPVRGGGAAQFTYGTWPVRGGGGAELGEPQMLA